MASTSRKQDRVVTIEIRTIGVVYHQQEKSYFYDVPVDDDQTVTVLDFSETWPEESGVLTYAVMHG